MHVNNSEILLELAICLPAVKLGNAVKADEALLLPEYIKYSNLKFKTASVILHLNYNSHLSKFQETVGLYPVYMNVLVTFCKWNAYIEPTGLLCFTGTAKAVSVALRQARASQKLLNYNRLAQMQLYQNLPQLQNNSQMLCCMCMHIQYQVT